MSALPDALPDHLEVDVVRAERRRLRRASAEIVAPAGVTIVTDPETDVASVVAPSAVIVEEVEEGEEEEPVEGADAGGGDSDDESAGVRARSPSGSSSGSATRSRATPAPATTPARWWSTCWPRGSAPRRFTGRYGGRFAEARGPGRPGRRCSCR